MELLLVSVVILVVQHGLTHAFSTLPKLRGNKLDDFGFQKYRLTKAKLDCDEIQTQAGSLRTLTISEALTSKNFKNHPFTSSLYSDVDSHIITDEKVRFKIVEIKATYNRPLYALHLQASGEKAYWVRPGSRFHPYSYIDIPQEPTEDEPQYVFTSDFFGSSLTVTPFRGDLLRIRHVRFETLEFNRLTEKWKGGNETYAMQYKDYGFKSDAEAGLQENYNAFAYMHYSKSKKRWILYVQQKMCSPEIGETAYANDTMTSVILLDPMKNKTVISTTVYSIPGIIYD